MKPDSALQNISNDKETAMLLKLLLGLRDGGHRVNVVRINGEQRPVLGKSHPEEEERRLAVVKQWRLPAESPRTERLATIDEPLAQRTQTILSHRLPPELRQRLDSGMGTLTDSRVKNQPGNHEQAEIAPPDLDE